jgi:hypothetical protein
VFVKVPVVEGVIERRMLVNYRVDPDAIARVLPAPFRPKLVDGSAIAGICLIRLDSIRPRGFPAALGVSSENAAHRIAVEWSDEDSTREGVFIPRRDSSSRLNRLLGGRLFPGVHHPARFDVHESGNAFHLEMTSRDGATHVLVDGHVSSTLPERSVFGTLARASAFFEGGSLGYSATARPGVYDGLELRSLSWRVEPLAVTAVRSSFFEDVSRFPPGSVEFDCALLMRNVQHEWRAREPMCVVISDAAA